MTFYQLFRMCSVANPLLLGDGICHNYGNYNTPGCTFDEGDCLLFNQEFPGCKAKYIDLLGDGVCDGGDYNTIACGYDGGDCPPISSTVRANPNRNLTSCEDVDYPYRIGDGRCDGGEYNTEACGFDDGDCAIFNSNYPNCIVDNPYRIGDGYCDGGAYNTEACGFEDGDCAYTRTYVIVQTVSSMISWISSIAIIWMIFRSYEKLSTTFHRLLLGLCIADIFSSFALSFSTLPAPDIASCRAQGFFIFLGSLGAPLYTCSMCLYYLCVVKYTMKEE